jgi:hypothetical protein
MDTEERDFTTEEALTALYSLATVGSGKFFKADLTALEKVSGVKTPIKVICTFAALGASTPEEMAFVKAAKSALVDGTILKDKGIEQSEIINCG